MNNLQRVADCATMGLGYGDEPEPLWFDGMDGWWRMDYPNWTCANYMVTRPCGGQRQFRTFGAAMDFIGAHMG